MRERKACAACGAKISTMDMEDGIAREVDGKYYCRKCLLDLGLLCRRRSETESFISEVKNVLGEVELTPQETVLVERKTRIQVTNFLEELLDAIEKHPSWGREEIISYVKSKL